MQPLQLQTLRALRLLLLSPATLLSLRLLLLAVQRQLCVAALRRQHHLWLHARLSMPLLPFRQRLQHAQPRRLRAGLLRQWRRPTWLLPRRLHHDVRLATA